MADRLEEAFAQTTSLLFGRPFSPLSKYEKWLCQRVPGGKNVKSCFGRGEAYVPEYGALRGIPTGRVVSEEDLEAVQSKRISGEKSAGSLSSIAAELKDFAYFVPAYAEGNNMNVEQSFLYLDCMNIRHCFDPFTSKNCAYCFSIMDAESIFGMHRIKGAGFSLHCYNSLKIQRCFEVDGGIDCKDSYFCHNVENLDSCIFCFNAKNLRYAIGNLELPREKYLGAKKRLVGSMAGMLEKNGRLDFDIYDCLCAR